MLRCRGWSLVEILTVLVMSGLLTGGLYTLFHQHGFTGGMKRVGVALAIGIPIAALIIWKNERDNKRQRQRLAEKQGGKDEGAAGQ